MAITVSSSELRITSSPTTGAAEPDGGGGYTNVSLDKAPLLPDNSSCTVDAVVDTCTMSKMGLIKDAVL